MEISGYKISNDLFYLGIKALIKNDLYKWVGNTEAAELLSIKYSKDLTDKIKNL